jgi:hypothetical protein
MSFQGSFQRLEGAQEIAREHCRSMEDFLSYKVGRDVDKACTQSLLIVKEAVALLAVRRSKRLCWHEMAGPSQAS